MNLRKKKSLAMRALGLGKEKIVFITSRLDEIKEAITKQDIRDLKKDGAIVIKDKKGKRKVKKKVKKSVGNVRKKVGKRKREYMLVTRKLRRYVAESKKQGVLTRDEVIEIRKKIRNRDFKSKANLKDYIENITKEKSK